jgi:trimethylamine:corrinoid methyltransferase-like protein
MAKQQDRRYNVPPYDPLSQKDVETILDSALRLMRETGVKFDPEPRGMELFSQAGCEISSEGVVKFPPKLVESSLESVGKRFTLWDRTGTICIECSTETTHFLAGITCPNVLDLESGEQRPSTAADLAMISRVTDALPNLDGVCLPCKIVEKSNVYGEMEEFATMIASTSKPIAYLSENELSLRVATEMGAEIRGGLNQLREKPYFSFAVTPLPLYYSQWHVEQIFTAIENGIPLCTGTGAIGGASTPITIAGNLVHCYATDFAGIVLTQLIEKGSFCSGASIAAFMDPATAMIGGLPESALAEMAKCQIARHLGLPHVGGRAGGGGGKTFDQHSASTAFGTMMETAYSRPAFCSFVGSVDTVMSFSMHQLVYCNELIGMLRRIWEGIHIDDDTLALDVTDAVGPGGNYLAEMHTVKHCRTEMWDTRYFRSEWGGAAAKDLVDKVDEHLHEILDAHEPEPLSPSVRERLSEILKKYGAEWPEI